MNCMATWSAIGFLLGGLATSAGAAQLPLFPDALEFVHGPVAGMAAADLDQDGDEDLVIVTGGAWPSSLEERGVLVRQNMGGGHFRTARLCSLHEAPGGVAVADLDGDGRVEIVVTLPNSNQVTVLRSSATGQFDEALLLAAGTAARQITIADVNADGRLDLVVGRGWGGPLLVLPARQPGVFDPPYELFPGLVVHKFLCADLDRDGRMDVMILSSGVVRIYHGLAGGAFGPWVRIPLPWWARDMRAIDLDGSGSLDLVIQTYSSRIFFSVLATGPRDYGTPHVEDALLMEYTPQEDGTMAVGDADGDGDDDVFMTDNAGNASVVLNERGSLSAMSRPAQTIAPVTSVLAADFDGDGRADLAAAGPTGEIDVSRSLRGGRLESAYAPFMPPRGANLAQGDVDRDGHLDLVLETATGFELRLGDGTGCFDAQVQFDLPLPNSNPLNDLALADLDADGDLDVTAVSWGGRVFVSRGDGSGGFGVASVQHSFTGGGWVKSGDVNGDGFLDWIFLEPWASARIAVQFGDGQGGFHPQTASPAPRSLSYLDVADFDEDGRDDLVSLVQLVYATDQVFVMYGHERGTVGRTRFFELGLDAHSLVTGDFDGDGHQDLALGYAGDATIGIGTVFMRGNGHGQLSPSPSLPPAEFKLGMDALAGDLSGDGRDDLVVRPWEPYLSKFYYQTTAFEVFLSDPSGSWTARGRYLDTQGGGDSFVADVDQDGRTDLIRYGGGPARNLAVYLQR